MFLKSLNKINKFAKSNSIKKVKKLVLNYAYNDKVLRSSEGMIFHIDIVKRDVYELVDLLHDKGYKVYGTKVDGGTDLKNVTVSDKCVIVMGNEGNGVSSKLLDKCDEYIYINMKGTCESLNVGVATSIILYELL